MGLKQKPELNGARGEVLQRQPGRGPVRWQVRLDDGHELAAQPKNLRRLGGDKGDGLARLESSEEEGEGG